MGGRGLNGYGKNTIKIKLKNSVLRLYLFIFRERRREREREGTKDRCVVAWCIPRPGDLAHRPGMCRDWDQTSTILVHRRALNPLNHTRKG